MKKWLKRILVAVLLAVFLFSGGAILLIRHQYAESRESYEEASAAFTHANPALAAQGGGSAGGAAGAGNVSGAGSTGGAADTDSGDISAEAAAEELLPPITVDFEAIKAVNEDVAGWIYCEGTSINYPILQGENNDSYLRRSYDRSRNTAGSIFIEELNSGDFSDGNTILYGHNMRDGSMFASLQGWLDQSFYEAHPVMWILTPERDYRVKLMAAYTTPADSAAYTIFSAPCPELDDYAREAVGRSAFRPRGEPESGARWVLLSTCAYLFDSARYVLHGMLCPVNSAGGVPKG